MRHRGVADATSVLPHRGRAPVGPGAAPRPAAVVVRAWILTTCQWRTQDARAHRTGDPRQPGLDPPAPNHGYRGGPHAPVTPLEPMNRHFQRAPGATERIFALTDIKLQVSKCRPRARGGVPSCSSRTSPPLSSSPRTRGCSPQRAGHRARTTVVPAHAGVFPCTGVSSTTTPCRPRARGGVPIDRMTTASGVCVVPAHAGVFRRPRPRGRRCWCRPRARGGVPYSEFPVRFQLPSSPRTRGCSERPRRAVVPRRVVPAHAGVFRIRS